MFGVRFSRSTSSPNYPLEITALIVVSPISGDHSKRVATHPLKLEAPGSYKLDYISTTSELGNLIACLPVHTRS